MPPVAATAGRSRASRAWLWQGLVAPAKTPPEIIEKLRTTRCGRRRSGGAAELIDAGAEVLQSTPQEFSDYRRKETAKWAEVITAAKLQLD